MTPRLLVSVRSPQEVASAIAGGCDLLDIKEPNRGSLGAADPETIAAIAEKVEAIPLSVALGELAEWPDHRTIPALPDAVAYAKLGLSNCRHSHGWAGRWRSIRRRFDDIANRPLAWIAVLYADGVAEGPDPHALIDLAAGSGCRGILVDTFHKDGRRLFDHARLEQIAEWRRAAASADLLFAVAGGLRAEDFPTVISVQPDIIAVRGAACVAGDRSASICLNSIKKLRSCLGRENQPR